MIEFALVGGGLGFLVALVIQSALLFHCSIVGINRNEVAELILYVVLSISVQVGCVYAMIWAGDQKEAKRNAEYDSIRQSGYRAGKDGVPVNANPYKAGSNNCLVWSEGWQQGFIDAKKSKGE